MHRESIRSDSSTTDSLAAFKYNDEQAMRAVYTSNFQKVEAYVLNNNGTTEEAKDVYQEAFIAVWRNIQLNKFTPQHQTSLSGYLYQIAKNKWLDHLRSGHYKKVIPLQSSENGLETDTAIDSEQEAYLQAVKNNFSKLGDNCQELLGRFYYRKQSLRTIASAFEWTEATAKNNKYRCLQRLRELVKNK